MSEEARDLAAAVPTLTLNNGISIPAIAFGVGTKWKKAPDGELDEDLVAALKVAYSIGFRHFDGAEYYGTEAELGAAVIKTAAKRSDLFITTKLKPSSGTNVEPHFEKSLKKLGVDYVDLYLIHNPFFDDDIVGIWKELEKIYKSGRAKAIGVSNFSVKDLEAILEVAEVKPAVNQIEHHAYLQDQSPDIVAFCKRHGIQVTGFGPLTPIVAAKGKGPLDPVIEEIAAKYKRTPGEILLRWVYQGGVIPITTSANPDRIRQALTTFDFKLDKADFDKITTVGATFEFRGTYNKYFEGH